MVELGKTFNDVFEYAILYPHIKHPLFFEKLELKLKYVGMLEYYARQYYGNNDVVKIRISSFRSNLLEGETTSAPYTFNQKADIAKVLKTRLAPFRLFSYRYVFLFDCLLILAPNDQILGNQICIVLKSLVHQRYHKGMDQVTKQMYTNTLAYTNKNLITTEMVNAWHAIQVYSKSENKNITFTATMSAGKSTLVNAIIGQELSHTKKATCTEIILKFISAPSRNHYFYTFSDGKSEGFLKTEEVREFTKGQQHPCQIIGNFASVLSASKMTLIDTPGINSSQSPMHKNITREQLQREETDVIIYVIPVENYGSEGDYEHLNYIKKKINYKRIIFVVNMIDICDSEDDSVEEIMANISDHLSSIGFENPSVHPISAKAGLLMKKALLGYTLSENDQRACNDFVAIFQEEALDLSTYYPKIVAVDLHQESRNEPANSVIQILEKAYINTGLPGFEKLLLDL